MSTINEKEFEEICDRAWSDRVAVLRRSGPLSGEAALVRAVFWRVRKAGINTRYSLDTSGSPPALLEYQSAVLQILKTSSSPPFEAAPILDALIDRFHSQGDKDLEF